jgi:hypothetical protein
MNGVLDYPIPPVVGGGGHFVGRRYDVHPQMIMKGLNQHRVGDDRNRRQNIPIDLPIGMVIRRGQKEKGDNNAMIRVVCFGMSHQVSDICVKNFEIAGISAMVISLITDFRTEGCNFLQGWTPLHPLSKRSVFCEGELARSLDDVHDDDWNIECIDPFDATARVLDT